MTNKIMMMIITIGKIILLKIREIMIVKCKHNHENIFSDIYDDRAIQCCPLFLPVFSQHVRHPQEVY